MLAKINFYLRFSALAVWFLVLSLVMVPVALLLWGNTSVAWLYARGLSLVGLFLLGIRVRVQGREWLRPPHLPAIIVANHQSNFDLILHGLVYPRRCVVIGKKELARIPLFGLLFKATGQIMIDRADRSKAIAGLDQAVEALQRRKVSIWIFPEGTRSKGQGLGRFKKGAFHMAVAAQVPLIPVVAEPIERVIDFAAKRLRPGSLRIRVLEPVATRGLRGADVDRLVAELEERFRRVLAEFEGEAAAVPA